MGRRIEIDKVYALLDAYKSGRLGGEKMPEDENPALDKSSKENYLYFTLPMALNYQRNSYKLWECANKTYKDTETTDVFDTKAVINMNEQQLREKLIKYKVALQPNKQPVIWRTICETIKNDLQGQINDIIGTKKQIVCWGDSLTAPRNSKGVKQFVYRPIKRNS